MQHVFLILLGFSLPVMAQGKVPQNAIPPNVVQQKEKTPSQKEEVVESTTLCDPHEAAKMPETFY